METQNYDKKTIYDKEIAPIIQELKKVCNYNRMPMFVTVAVSNSPTDTAYESDMVYASTQVSLAKKNLPQLLLLLNEFESQLPQKVRHSIAVIEDYYANLDIDPNTSTHINGAVADVSLHNDLVERMNGVINGNDTVIIPDMK